MMETTYGDYHHYVHHHPHLITTDDDSSFTNMNHNGFSRGSSTSFAYPPPQQPPDYHRYFVDRGEFAAAATRFSLPTSSSLVDNNNNNSLDAAGIGFAGNPQAPPSNSNNNNFVIPEDISVYNNQWNWTQPDQPTILAPAPVYPHQTVKNSATINSLSSAVAVCSQQPTAQLPTPAAMAVLLNPNLQTDFEIPQGSEEAESVIQTVTRPAVMLRPPVEPVVAAVQSVPDSPSREKKHACTMCHKR